MKQNPSRLKYKKYHRPSSFLLYCNEQKNFFALRGQFALRALENNKLTYNQIEACRKSIRRMLNKKGIVILRIFTNISLTKKALGSRMGKGKGSHYLWVSNVKKGQIICEIICNIKDKLDLVIKALKTASTKLSIKTAITYNYY